MDDAVMAGLHAEGGAYPMTHAPGRRRRARGHGPLVFLMALLPALGLAACGGGTSGTPASAGPDQPPRPAASDVCGGWSSPTSALGSAIRARYGGIRNCLLEGRTWVIATLGGHGTQPIIALYPCSSADAACMDGRQPHPLAGWRFVRPPYPGGVTVLGRPSAHALIVDVGGHQLTFDVITHRFSP